MLRFVLLSFLVAAPAFAYETTQFKLLVTRQTIRDAHPVEVSDGGPLLVRYDYSGTCYVIGKTTEYACKADYDYGRRQFSLYLHAQDFARLALDELTWTQPTFRSEFYAFVPKDGDLRFTASAADGSDMNPKSIEIDSQSFKSRDGKIEYVAQ